MSALNTPPLPSFIFSPSRPNIGQTATFDAGATTDDESIPDNGFDWDFDGNGTTDAEGRSGGARVPERRRPDGEPARDRRRRRRRHHHAQP